MRRAQLGGAVSGIDTFIRAALTFRPSRRSGEALPVTTAAAADVFGQSDAQVPLEH